MAVLSIEIKAKCSDQNKIRDILKSLHADFKGVDYQIDTYFRVSNGRLKLREGSIENNLIHYDRMDGDGPKQSNITLFKSEPGSTLKEVLLKSVGKLAVVEKHREIYFIENVKFHLDDVKELGTFMEIEALDKNGTIGKEKLVEQCNHYLELFGIKDSDLLSDSYSDQILRKS